MDENLFLENLEKYSWHSISADQSAEILNTDFQKGLSEKEAKDRRKRFGFNRLPQRRSFSKWKLFLSQFSSPLVYILLIAALITLFIGKWTDSIVIFIAVAINAAFGFWEESKTSNILNKLKKILREKAIVLRNGQKKQVLREELVPGDVIYLQAGDKVPADARIIKSKNLKVDESILTGEWAPALKQEKPLPKDTLLSNRTNMVFMGCLIVNGWAKAVVVETGGRTQTGRIANLIEEAEDTKTPIQKGIFELSRVIGGIIIVSCLLIFIVGWLRFSDVLEMFETSVAIAVGGIPEALPIMVTIVLAIGAERILRRKGLIKRLSSVETFGSVQIVCFDKTRTLTQGKMQLEKVVANDKSSLFKIAALCNNAFIENPESQPSHWKIIGSPTDKALIEAARNFGYLKPELEKKSKQKAFYPFNPERKYLISLRKEQDRHFIYISGSPEKILNISAFADKQKNQKWGKEIEKLTNQGLRVIGFAQKEIQPEKAESLVASGQDSLEKISANLLKNFEFIGLMALKDPLRPDVKEAVKTCREAGMRPILITGDHFLTARAVAREVGLGGEGKDIIQGNDLDKLTDGELESKLEEISVYARTEPRHKMRIVKAWQNKGKVVAMTGDGINDAPALKQADIGIALSSGTEVAKESSDLILLDDSFSVIIKAIEEGRIIFDNLRKSIAYILSDSFASVILVGFATVIFGWPLPILPVQILWNNFIEDTLPDIAYAFEPGEKGIMQRKPYPSKRGILNKEMKVLIFGAGIVDQFITLFLFWLLWKYFALDINYVRTMIFGAVSLDTAFVVFSYKSFDKNIWQTKIFSNKWLNFSSLLCFVAFAAAVYFPPFQKILATVPIGIGSWVILFFVGLGSMFLVEVTKYFFITKKNKKRMR